MGKRFKEILYKRRYLNDYKMYRKVRNIFIYRKMKK